MKLKELSQKKKKKGIKRRDKRAIQPKANETTLASWFDGIWGRLRLPLKVGLA